MIRTTIRSMLIATGAVAALAVPASASALGMVRSPGSVTAVPVVQTTTAVALKEAGSAGVEGYDDKKCEFLLSEYNRFHQAAANYAGYGDTESAVAVAEEAGAIKGELESNCFTVD